MPKKETSSRVSTIAAKCVRYPKKATLADIKTMAASCLSQDETAGQGFFSKVKKALGLGWKSEYAEKYKDGA